MAGSEKTFVNGSSPSCAAEDLNGFELENNNLIEGSGQTLDDEDHDQTHNAVAIFASNGDFYTGSGSANTYAANPVSPKKGIFELQNGAQIRFVIPATNTGASTINVNSLGVKNLKNWDGSALAGYELVQGEIVTVVYNSGSDEWRLVNRSALLSLVPPVGSLIPWLDYNGALTFDSNYYAHMDGSVLSDAHSPLNGETLTDMSGRYLVGFGTDGGGDIDSAVWSANPVGNAGHEVDVQHDHDVGTLQFKVAQVGTDGGGSSMWMYNIGGSLIKVITHAESDGSGNNKGYASNNGDYYTASGTGSVDTGGSATQDIQPRSIPCRVLIRKR